VLCGALANHQLEFTSQSCIMRQQTFAVSLRKVVGFKRPGYFRSFSDHRCLQMILLVGAQMMFASWSSRSSSKAFVWRKRQCVCAFWLTPGCKRTDWDIRKSEGRSIQSIRTSSPLVWCSSSGRDLGPPNSRRLKWTWSHQFLSSQIRNIALLQKIW